MKRLNILFSTTRYRNVGDEFIMQGIENLLEEIGLKYNKIIFNRNQEINSWFEFLNPFRGKLFDKLTENVFFQLIRTYIKLGFFDNSFAYKYYDLHKNIDYIIFAGTPEWSGYRNKILYDLINKENKKALFLGIGEAGHPWHKTKKWIINGVKKAKLIILRNPEDFDNFKKFNKNTYYFSCPALFCSKKEKKINEIRKIGITFSFPNSLKSHSLNNKVFNELIKFIKFLKKNINFKLYAIFHNIKDFYLFHSEDYKNIKKLFEDNFYSGDKEDYFKFYENFDLVVSTRVHGNGISSSLGIPNIAFTHDNRGSTVLGFGSYIVKNFDDAKIVFEKILKNIQNENIRLKNIKQKQKEKWIEVLKKNLIFNN